MTQTQRDKQHLMPAAGLSQMLEEAIHAEGSETPTDDDDIARTSIRIPRTVLDEVSALAQANRMSVSLLVNLLLDTYLVGEGRPGYAKLAPWYSDYALRKKPQVD